MIPGLEDRLLRGSSEEVMIIADLVCVLEFDAPLLLIY